MATSFIPRAKDNRGVKRDHNGVKRPNVNVWVSTRGKVNARIIPIEIVPFFAVMAITAILMSAYYLLDYLFVNYETITSFTIP